MPPTNERQSEPIAAINRKESGSVDGGLGQIPEKSVRPGDGLAVPPTNERSRRELCLLWYVQDFFWRLPWPLWILGNRVADVRFYVHKRTGWVWI